MYILSIDLETTGLEPTRCQILEIAMILDHDQVTPINMLPSYEVAVEHEEVIGEPYALAMNQELLYYIDTAKNPRNRRELFNSRGDLLPIVKSHRVKEEIETFLEANVPPGEPIVVTGKNPGSFDLQFLKNDARLEIVKLFYHAVLDPGSMFVQRTDKRPPSLQTVLKRAEIQGIVAHRAYGDAVQTLEAVRKYLTFT